MDQRDGKAAIVTGAMARTSKGDKGELEKLVSATKESYQSPPNVNTAGIAANVVQSRRKLLEDIEGRRPAERLPGSCQHALPDLGKAA